MTITLSHQNILLMLSSHLRSLKAIECYGDWILKIISIIDNKIISEFKTLMCQGNALKK